MTRFSYFWRLNNIPLCIYTTFLFIYSFVIRYLGCFYLLAIMDNIAINMGVQVSFGDPTFNFFRYIPQSGIAESYDSSIFNFFQILPMVHHFKTLATKHRVFNFSKFLPTLAFFFFSVSILTAGSWYLIVVLTYTCLMINNIEHLFICLLAFSCLLKSSLIIPRLQIWSIFFSCNNYFCFIFMMYRNPIDFSIDFAI